MQRKASAVWRGGLKDGKGVISTDSGVLSDTGTVTGSDGFTASAPAHVAGRLREGRCTG